MSGYLVTGATGSIGAALAVRLLDTADHTVYATADAPDAVRDSLRAAAVAFGYAEDLADRAQVVAPAGIADLSGLTEVWHCPSPAALGDTPAVLAAATTAGARRFHHLGTAFVAGGRTGSIAESDPIAEEAAQNQFERDHIRAEQAVAAATGIDTRIWRPGIVVGHSRTHLPTGPSEFSGLVAALLRTKAAFEGMVGPLLSMRAMPIVLDPETALDIVPVDVLVGQALELAHRADVDAPVVHLTNKTPTPLRRVLAAAFRQAGLHQPTYVESTVDCLGLEEKFDAEIRSYGSCFTVSRDFEQEAARRAGAELDFPIADGLLDGICAEYVRRAGQQG